MNQITWKDKAMYTATCGEQVKKALEGYFKTFRERDSQRDYVLVTYSVKVDGRWRDHSEVCVDYDKDNELRVADWIDLPDSVINSNYLPEAARWIIDDYFDDLVSSEDRDYEFVVVGASTTSNDPSTQMRIEIRNDKIKRIIT